MISIDVPTVLNYAGRRSANYRVFILKIMTEMVRWMYNRVKNCIIFLLKAVI